MILGVDRLQTEVAGSALDHGDLAGQAVRARREVPRSLVPELEALACAVGSVKSMIAIGPVNEPDPENSMVKKSWFTTQAGFACGVAVSSGSASSVNTVASKGWVLHGPVARVQAVHDVGDRVLEPLRPGRPGAVRARQIRDLLQGAQVLTDSERPGRSPTTTASCSAVVLTGVAP